MILNLINLLQSRNNPSVFSSLNLLYTLIPYFCTCFFFFFFLSCFCLLFCLFLINTKIYLFPVWLIFTSLGPPSCSSLSTSSWILLASILIFSPTLVFFPNYPLFLFTQVIKLLKNTVLRTEQTRGRPGSKKDPTTLNCVLDPLMARGYGRNAISLPFNILCFA